MDQSRVPRRTCLRPCQNQFMPLPGPFPRPMLVPPPAPPRPGLSPPEGDMASEPVPPLGKPIWNRAELEITAPALAPLPPCWREPVRPQRRVVSRDQCLRGPSRNQPVRRPHRRRAAEERCCWRAMFRRELPRYHRWYPYRHQLQRVRAVAEQRWALRAWIQKLSPEFVCQCHRTHQPKAVEQPRLCQGTSPCRCVCREESHQPCPR